MSSEDRIVGGWVAWVAWMKAERRKRESESVMCSVTLEGSFGLDRE